MQDYLDFERASEEKPTKHKLRYPDASIACESIFLDEKKDVLVTPCVIFEVLSESTEKTDRVTKFDEYRTIPSFQEHVLLRQHMVLLERYARQPDGTWNLYSLHPLLTRLLMRRFLAGTTTGAAGQLIFTTHDTNLLDLRLLRTDEIWFVEKSPGDASELYSLAEFKSEQLGRLSDSLEEGYLNGRFGAIPFFGDPTRLGLGKTGTEPR